MTDIVKSGWLQRRTTILKNWKREWFILTNDARLRRMSAPDKQYDTADGIFQLNRSRELCVGSEQVPANIDPPNDSTREQLMQLVPSEGDAWILCAESTDDLLAWQTSFDDVRQLYIERMQRQQARISNTQIPSGRCDYTYYRRGYTGYYPHRIYRTRDGSRETIIIVDQDSYYDTDYDIATGALTGLALSSLILLPFFLLPLMLL